MYLILRCLFFRTAQKQAPDMKKSHRIILRMMMSMIVIANVFIDLSTPLRQSFCRSYFVFLKYFPGCVSDSKVYLVVRDKRLKDIDLE